MNDPSELAEDVEPALEASQEEVRTAAVPVTLHGQRLDRVLAQLVPEFSRSYLQQLIEQGEALIDGRVTTKVSAKVRLGHQLQITLRATPQSQAFVPEAMPIDVVYEDAHLRVIHKPAGLVVHPAPGNWRGTLLNGLLALDPKASEVPRAGIVHRLDKDTSGLMVVARTRQAMDALVTQIAARQVHRQYLALGHKNWTGPSPRTLVSPRPSCPFPLPPQHFTRPSSNSAHVCASPVATARAVRPVPSGTACSAAPVSDGSSPTSAVDPVPSRPSRPEPTHTTDHAAVTTQACASPPST